MVAWCCRRRSSRIIPCGVMVTILESGEEEALSELGDYLDRLTDYEERLARGEIQWQ